MFRLFFLVAFRHFYRDKLTSVIQLCGLVVGIACYLLIGQYVAYQYSYNTQFTDANSIYRIHLFRDDNKPQTLTPIRLASELTSNFQQIEDVTRISSSSVSVKQRGGVYAEQATFVDSNFFDFFDFELLEGDIYTALNSPNSVVLHQALAQKYFGQITNVIGRSLTINGEQYLVTGVIKKSLVPHTLPETLLLPLKSYFTLLPNIQWTQLWNFNATITFAKIAQAKDVSFLNSSVSSFYDDRAKGLTSFKRFRVEFEPLLDVYLNNTTTRPLVPSGSKLMVTAFSIIAVLILFLACVNFTNLATAAAMRRSKDVGVRKAIGASRLQLIAQYLFESTLLTLVATVFALLLISTCLPWFNQLMNVDIKLIFGNREIVELIIICALVSLLAGGYPAFFLSNQPAALVLKGVVNSSRSNVLFRQCLIVLQFSVAAFLLVTSLVVNWQMNYVQNMPQGYEKEGVLVVNRGAQLYNTFKAQAMQMAEVEAVTMSHTVPTKATRTSHMVRKLGEIDNEIWVGNNPVSYDYFMVFGIELLAGRGFSKAYINDAYEEDKQNVGNSTGKLVINQTLANTLGWGAEQAIGKSLILGASNEGLHTHQIIGVTQDTHYINAKNQVPPMLYVLSEQPQDLSLRWLSIRLAENASLETVKNLERIWLSLDNNVAFKYDWLSELFTGSYRNEILQTKLLNLFTILAFLVTSIGLLGLAAFITQRKTKEIAIRKVLGASNRQLCFMLLSPFTALIVLANVLVLPIAYWQMSDWLNNFIYRMALPISAFAISLLLSLAVAYITILLIAIKAVRARPVSALASE